MSEQFSRTLSNTTVYNQETIAETARALRYSGMKRRLIRAAIIAVLGILLIFSDSSFFGYAFLAGIVLGFVLVFALSGKRTKRIAARIMTQLKTTYHTDEFNCEMLVDDKEIRGKTPNTEREMYHSDIKKIYETEKLFVIIYNGGIWIAVDKNGFTEGGPEEFRALIGRERKKKK